MRYPVFMTLLWDFSFSLIGKYLIGRVDSYLAVLTRGLIAASRWLTRLDALSQARVAR